MSRLAESGLTGRRRESMAMHYDRKIEKFWKLFLNVKIYYYL